MIRSCLRWIGSLFGMMSRGRKCPLCGGTSCAGCRKPIPQQHARHEGESGPVLGRDLGFRLLSAFGLEGQMVRRMVLTVDVEKVAELEVTRFVLRGEADGVVRDITSFLCTDGFTRHTLEPYEEVTERFAIVRAKTGE